MSNKLTFTVKPLQRVVAQFDPIARDIAIRVLQAEAERIMTISKGLVPVDTGALRASGVAGVNVEGGKVSMVLSYGGPAVDYAVIVHEDLSAYHPNGQAKYLEEPMLDAVNGMEARLAESIRAELGSALGRLGTR